MQLTHYWTWLWAASIFCFATAASAQSRYRTEVFGSVGVSAYLARSRVNVGGGVGFRPFSADRSPFLRMLGLEVESNVTSGTLGTVSCFTGNLLFHIPAGRTEPYLLAGLGASHQRGLGTGGVIDVGAGVKIFLTTRVSLRPELRAFAPVGSTFARASVAVGYHW